MISTTRRTPWREGIVAGLLAFAAFRVVTELVGVAAAYRGGAAGRVARDPLAAFRVWQQWDVNWFADLSRRGYQAMGRVVNGTEVHDGTAFPPAMPALMHAGQVLGAPPAVSGILLSAVFLAIALALLYVLVRDDQNESIARWTLVFLLVYPFALFLGTGYAESLVLLGTVGAWLAARRGAWWLAGMLVGVALLAKIVFILLLVPLSLEAMDWRGGRSLAFDRRRALRLVALWLPALVALGGWMLYLGVIFGEPLRFLAAQRGWGRAIGFPIAQVGYIFDRSRNAGVRFIDAIDSLSLVLLAVMTVYVYRRVRPAYAALLGVLLAVFLFNTSLISNGRHLGVLFPIFIALAVMTEGRRWLRPVLVLVQLPLGLLLVTRFATGHWAG